jgi:hypothetical protein
MKIPVIDKKMQWVSRLFFMAFSIMLFQMIFIGEYSYYSMGYERFVSAESHPVKFYFGIIWCSLMMLVSGVFGFVAKRK